MSNQKNALQAIIERFFELQELKYREWDEDFIDEDTGDVVTIKRRELVTEESSLEEEQLLEQINSQLSEIDTDTLFRLKDEIIWGTMDKYSIWKELNDRGALGFPWKLIQDGVAILPEDMEEIPENYFQCCYFLTSVVFPKNLKRIGKGAFYLCESITDMRIPDGVTSIGDDAFEHCDSLNSVYIPDSVTEIGYHAFLDCHSLKSAYVGKGVKELRCQVFGRCYNLESVILSEGLEIINSSTFDSCWNLRGLEIPCSVKEIGKFAFEECYFLTDKYVNNSNVKGNFGEIIADVIQDDGLMIKDNQVIDCWRTDSVVIPRSVTHINEGALAEAYIKECHYAGTIEEWKKIVCEPDLIDVVHCVERYAQVV